VSNTKNVLSLAGCTDPPASSVGVACGSLEIATGPMFHSFLIGLITVSSVISKTCGAWSAKASDRNPVPTGSVTLVRPSAIAASVIVPAMPGAGT
jgi:uncharacterized membrane protein YbhN (UPF0104 family)